MSELTEQEKYLLQHYRKTIISMSYTPLSNDEVVIRKARRRNAEASAAIEGLQGDSMDHALFDLFDELQAPGEIYRIILNEYTNQQLCTQGNGSA